MTKWTTTPRVLHEGLAPATGSRLVALGGSRAESEAPAPRVREATMGAHREGSRRRDMRNRVVEIAMIVPLAVASCRDRSVPQEPPARIATTAAASAKAPAEAAPERGAFNAVYWSPNGRVLAEWGHCACSEGSRFEGVKPGVCAIRMWDLPHGRISTTIQASCSKGVSAVGFSPSGEILIVGDFDTVRAYRVVDGQRLFETGPMALGGHFDWNPDGTLLFRTNPHGNVELLRLADGKVLRRAQILRLGADGDWHGGWSPDGKLIAVAAEGVPFRIWDGATAAPIREISIPEVGPVDIHHCLWLPDSRRVVLANDNGLLAITNVRSGVVKVLRRPDGDHRTRLQTSVSLSHDGKHVAVLDAEGRIELWDVASRSRRELLAAQPTEWNGFLNFSPDDRYVSLYRHDAIRVFALGTTGEPQNFDFHADAGPGAPLGWGAEAVYYGVRGKTLLGFSGDGVQVFRHVIDADPEDVRLAPSRRFAVVRGRDLELVRLRDGHSVTLAMREVGGRAEGFVRGATDEAALAAFFEAP